MDDIRIKYDDDSGAGDALFRLRREMEKSGVDFYAAFTCDPHGSEYLCSHYKSVEYFSGFTGDNARLLVGRDSAFLWTDGRFFIQAEKELDGGIELMRMGEAGVPDFIDYLSRYLQGGDTGDGLRREPMIVEEDSHTLPEGRPGCGMALASQISCIPPELSERLFALARETGLKIVDGTELTDRVWTGRPPVIFHPAESVEPLIYGGSIAEKLFRVREEMKKCCTGRLVLRSLDDVMWLFNLRGSDIPFNTLAYSYGAVTEEEAYLYIAPGVLSPRTVQLLEDEGVTLRDYCDFESMEEEPAAGAETGATAGAEAGAGSGAENDARSGAENDTAAGARADAGSGAENHTAAGAKADAGSGAENHTKAGAKVGAFRGCRDNPVRYLKSIKTEAQTENIRAYFEKDSAALIRFLYWFEKEGIHSGVTETGAAAYLKSLREQTEGFLGESFPTISAYGANAAMAHYAPSEEEPVTVESCGFYLCDSGGFYPGVTTDVTRTVACGELTEQEKTGYTLVAAGWASLMGCVFREGCTGRNLDILARERLWERGLDYGHGTGHGVGAGLCVHEGPQAIRWRQGASPEDAELKAGMLITDEPGIYMAQGDAFGCENDRCIRGFGVRIENTLLVREHEKRGFLCFESLTLAPIDKRPLITGLLSDRERRRIDDYHRLVWERMEKYFAGDIREWLRESCSAIQ